MIADMVLYPAPSLMSCLVMLHKQLSMQLFTQLSQDGRFVVGPHRPICIAAVIRVVRAPCELSSSCKLQYPAQTSAGHLVLICQQPLSMSGGVLQLCALVCCFMDKMSTCRPV